jgi:UDP-N-acetyl-D-mannosaminuronate dehydrogenase
MTYYKKVTVDEYLAGEFDAEKNYIEFSDMDFIRSVVPLLEKAIKDKDLKTIATATKSLRRCMEREDDI